MNIYMIGMNYSNADIDQREMFSLNNDQQIKIAKKLIDNNMTKGCIFLSTCNRTELWLSSKDEMAIDFFIHEVLTDHNVDLNMKEDIKNIFTIRKGEDAIEYILELACGIHSQIFGEDQILGQLKMAAENARKYKYTDSVLEALFRTAITGAKKVKTEIVLSNKNKSLPETIISRLEEREGSLREKRCLVIGNGEMGKLMTHHLIEKGAKVEMTLRQYKRKEAIIPSECGVVLYEDRYNNIEGKEYIFSATRSPHYTINLEEIENIISKERKYHFIDMALPRDIDPRIDECENATVLHIDDFGVKSECSKEILDLVKNILIEYKNDFINWYHTRSLAPKVNEVSEVVGEITNCKLRRVYKSININEEEKEFLQTSVQVATKKAISKIIFELRENMDIDQYNQLIKLLQLTTKNAVY